METFLRYTRLLGLEQPHYEHQLQGRLPPFYADMFGWEERVKAAADYFHTLTPREQEHTAVAASNYGDAGAVDFFGPRYGLPKAISTHQNYWIWGPRRYTGESVLLIGFDDPDGLRRACTSLSVVATPLHPNARPEENRPIYHCLGLRSGLQEAWPALKSWN